MSYEAKKVKQMRLYYLSKINLLTRKNILLPYIGVSFILILITINNTYGSNLLLAVINQFNQTLEKDLLFIPIGIFIIRILFDNRSIYKIRYTSLKVWLKRDAWFLMIILFFYTMVYVLLAVITNIIATFFLTTGNIQIDFLSINFMILLTFRRYLFLLMLLNCIIAGTLITDKGTHIIGFVCYIFFELLQLLEMITSVSIIRPNVDISLSLFDNLIYLIPTVGLLILTAAFNFRLINGGKF